MKLTLPRVIGLLITLCAGTPNAAGLLNLSHTEIHIESGQPVYELYAENIGDTPLYLSVEQTLLSNPGEQYEILVPIEEIDKPALLVVPNRLVLAPGQKYRMDLKVVHEPSKRQIWRVTFLPRELIRIKPDLVTQETSPLFVSVGYGVVIYQTPDKSRFTK